MAKTSNLDPNDTVMAILRHIIKSKGATVYSIAKALKIPHQKVGYHMPGLEEAGLVLSDEVEGVRIFIPQPIFVDEEFSSAVETAMDAIYQASGVASDKVYAKTEKLEDIAAIVENCTRAKVILSMCS
jgi:DNA-binding transcriptional ArsR family regulator